MNDFAEVSCFHTAEDLAEDRQDIIWIKLPAHNIAQIGLVPPHDIEWAVDSGVSRHAVVEHLNDVAVLVADEEGDLVFEAPAPIRASAISRKHFYRDWCSIRSNGSIDTASTAFADKLGQCVLAKGGLDNYGLLELLHGRSSR